MLDYFDAVKIGLTATPAKHTTDIFGKPVYTYSYREAVADDWLIDHEPPIRYETLLSRHGIHFDKGQQVEALNLPPAKSNPPSWKTSCTSSSNPSTAASSTKTSTASSASSWRKRARPDGEERP